MGSGNGGQSGANSRTCRECIFNGASRDLETVGCRYRWLAAIYPILRTRFSSSRGIRKKAVETLGLMEVETVLEVGRSTSGNLPHLVADVGAELPQRDYLNSPTRSRLKNSTWARTTFAQRESLTEPAENVDLRDI